LNLSEAVREVVTLLAGFTYVVAFIQ